jgi:hypothetical protein
LRSPPRHQHAREQGAGLGGLLGLLLDHLRDNPNN